MAENRRGRDNRFFFSRGQMVLLGGAFTLAAAVIFMLGMFVGKVIEENKLTNQEEPLVKIPVGPGGQGTASAQAPLPRDEITFNSSAAKAVGAPVPAKTREPKAAEETAKAEPREAKSVSKTTTAAERATSTQGRLAPRTSEAPKQSGTDAARQTVTQGVVWRAQVNAFPDVRSAEQLVERLKNKGYNAYKTEVLNQGKTWYRVSVGQFNSRTEAEKAVETLRTKENLSRAFVASK